MLEVRSIAILECSLSGESSLSPVPKKRTLLFLHIKVAIFMQKKTRTFRGGEVYALDGLIRNLTSLPQLIGGVLIAAK